MFTHERLGEEVRNVVRRWDERDAQLAVLNALTNEVVPTLNVFCLRVVLRIVSKIDGGFVVQTERRRLGHVKTKFTQKRRKVYGFLRSL